VIEKLKAFWNVFRKGQSVADPAMWKLHQITANMIAALLTALVAVARVYGIDLHVTDSQLLEIGGAILTVVSLFSSGVTVASSEKIGLPPLADRPSDPAVSAIPESVQPTVPPVGQPVLGPGERLAANGDVIKPINRDA
jgi:hypothetical protein